MCALCGSCVSPAIACPRHLRCSFIRSFAGWFLRSSATTFPFPRARTHAPQVIEQTRQFLEAGKAPQRGIDDVDRLLMRKRYLMGKCGVAESHRLAEKGDVLRPGVLEARAEAAARAADEATAAAVAAAEAQEYGEEIDLDAQEDDEKQQQHSGKGAAGSGDDDDSLDDMDMLDLDDEIDALLDSMVSAADDDGTDGLPASSSSSLSSSKPSSPRPLFVRGNTTDKMVVSAALMCAVRVSVMNETDVDLLCPRARGAWDDHKCEDEIFNECVLLLHDAACSAAYDDVACYAAVQCARAQQRVDSRRHSSLLSSSSSCPAHALPLVACRVVREREHII